MPGTAATPPPGWSFGLPGSLVSIDTNTSASTTLLSPSAGYQMVDGGVAVALNGDIFFNAAQAPGVQNGGKLYSLDPSTSQVNPVSADYFPAIASAPDGTIVGLDQNTSNGTMAVVRVNPNTDAITTVVPASAGYKVDVYGSIVVEPNDAIDFAVYGPGTAGFHLYHWNPKSNKVTELSTDRVGSMAIAPAGTLGPTPLLVAVTIVNGTTSVVTINPANGHQSSVAIPAGYQVFSPLTVEPDGNIDLTAETGGQPPIGLYQFNAATGQVNSLNSNSFVALATPLLHGIDVSHYQGAIDWKTLAMPTNGIEFAFAKATNGTAIDPFFQTNWVPMQGLGIPIGAYCYGIPGTTTSAVLQAEMLYNTVKPRQGQLLILDLETAHGQTPAHVWAWTKAFVSEIVKLSGRPPLINTSYSFWQTYVAAGTQSTNLGAPLWIAQYPPTPKKFSQDPKPIPPKWSSWDFWQFADDKNGVVTGRQLGITGAVDWDYFNGTAAQLQAFVGQHGVSVPWQ
jgi:lysozyme